MLSCKVAAYFQNTFSYEHLWVAATEYVLKYLKMSYLFYVLKWLYVVIMS